MKVKFLALIIIALVVITACNSAETATLVKSVYSLRKYNQMGQEISNGGITNNLFYTPEGEFSYALFSNGNKATVQKNGNTVVFKEADSTGKEVYTMVTYLDAQGREDSFDQMQNGKVLVSHKFIYDQNGFVVEDRHYMRGKLNFTMKHTIADGNSIMDELIYPAVADTQKMVNPKTGKEESLVLPLENMTTYKQYFTDKIRMPVNVNFGNKLKDRGSRHLEKLDVVLNSKKDTLNIVDHRYTFDVQGRVASAVTVTRGGGEYDSVAYTYY